MRNRGLVALAATVLAVVLGGLWIWDEGAERRALLRMPVDERRSLYEQTRRTAESLCRPARSDRALRDRCDDLSDFLIDFPECDEQCGDFARSLTSRPTR
jgi:hypothetical protein